MPNTVSRSMDPQTFSSESKTPMFPSVFLCPTLSIPEQIICFSLSFFFLKPRTRTTASVKASFVEHRHVRGGSFFPCASTLAWVFLTSDLRRNHPTRCSEIQFSEHHALSFCTDVSCPDRPSEHVCWWGRGGVAGRCDFS